MILGVLGVDLSTNMCAGYITGREERFEPVPHPDGNIKAKISDDNLFQYF